MRVALVCHLLTYVVAHANELTSVKKIMEQLPIFDGQHALRIFEIVHKHLNSHLWIELVSLVLTKRIAASGNEIDLRSKLAFVRAHFQTQRKRTFVIESTTLRRA